MNNCGCKRPAVGPEPHAPVPLHGGGFVPNAIEWLKKKIDKLFGTAVFTVNGHEPEGGNVKIVLDDLADKDGNIETTKNIMVSRDGGESHVAVALYSDLISEIDAHNNNEAAHPKLMATVARDYATKTEVEKKYDKTGGPISGDVSISGSLSLTGSAPKITANQKDFSFPNESGKLARAEDYYTTAEVDNKITTFVAHYLTGKDSAGHFVPFATRAALDYAKQHHTEEDPQFFYAGEPFTPTKNDYCVVLADETVGGKTARYSFVGEWPTGSWQYQYTINDTAFSEAQWAAINSGVTGAWMESTLSALQAEVDRAKAAENAAQTKANELDTTKADKSALTTHVNNKENPHAVTAEQTGAVPFVVDSSGKKTAVTIGSRKIDSSVGEDSFANGSDVTAAGRSSHAEGVGTTAYDGAHAEGVRTTAMGYYSHAEGQNTIAVANGSHTDGIYSCTLRYDDYSYTWNGDGTKTEDSLYTSHGYGTFNINPDGGLRGFWIGEQTLEAIIAAAISGKANKSELPYSLVVKGIENGTVSLDDRADNYVDARALGSSNSLDIDFPVLVDGRSRDFVLAVECGENPPTISYAAFATIMAEDASTLAPEQGMNIYAFTEFKTNVFLVARKTVDTVVVNTPESSNQVLLAMQKRGIDTTNITDFGKVANTLGLGDTATPQDAIDAVMN